MLDRHPCRDRHDRAVHRRHHALDISADQTGVAGGDILDDLDFDIDVLGHAFFLGDEPRSVDRHRQHRHGEFLLGQRRSARRGEHCRRSRKAAGQFSAGSFHDFSPLRGGSFRPVSHCLISSRIHAKSCFSISRYPGCPNNSSLPAKRWPLLNSMYTSCLIRPGVRVKNTTRSAR